MLEKTLVMQGTFADVALTELLQVLAGSRQLTSLEIQDDRGRSRASVLLKSGKVVAVTPALPDAQSAVRRLVSESAPGAFVVFRLPDSDSLPTPVASVEKLLFEILASAPEATAAPAQPPAAPAAPATVSRKVSPATTPPPSSKAVNGAPRVPYPTRTARPRPNAPEPAPAASRAPILAVCSPKGGVGKTTIALHLATAIARRGVRTVLVDVDPNGDIISALDAQERVTRGVYDVLGGATPLASILRSTKIPSLRVAPARGVETPVELLERETEQLPRLLAAVASHSEIVIVDCPAGMFGATQRVLEVATHALGILQAETIASRSFKLFGEVMKQTRSEARVLGVVANMFNARSDTSYDAIKTAMAAHGSDDLLFQTMIPRTEVFDQAAHDARPLHEGKSGQGANVSFLFDMLAGEVSERLQFRPHAAPSEQDPFLV